MSVAYLRAAVNTVAIRDEPGSVDRIGDFGKGDAVRLVAPVGGALPEWVEVDMVGAVREPAEEGRERPATGFVRTRNRVCALLEPWADGAAAAAALGPVGWQGSFHVDVDVAAGANFTVALYFADYGAWNASIFLQTRALDGLAVVAEAAVLRDFRGGAYVSFAADRSLRFRVMQLNDRDGDRDGWPPPPTLTALFFG